MFFMSVLTGEDIVTDDMGGALQDSGNEDVRGVLGVKI
jgi:hypothetical protein